MPNANNVIQVKFPQTAAQASKLKKLVRRDKIIELGVTILADEDSFREQRAWRVLFGLYQDCACIGWSKGFEKIPGCEFTGKMRSSMLPLFLREAMPFVAANRAIVSVNGERIRRRILDVMAA